MSIIEIDPDLTIDMCVHIADLVEHHFTANLGYDSASLRKVQVDEWSIDVVYDLQDDFQKDLKYDEAVYSGYTTFNVYPKLRQPINVDRFSEALWSQVKAIPSREMRELQITVKQLNHMSQSLKGIRHEQAKQFVEDIVKQAGEFTQALEHYKGEQDV